MVYVPEGGHELPPVDHAVSVVELVSNSVHLQAGGGELVLKDALHELIPAREKEMTLGVG